MARDPQSALVALNRFGLGARGNVSGDFVNAASDPRGFVKADRTFAAQDPQEGLAVHAHLAGNLMPRLVSALDAISEGTRDTVVRVSRDGRC